VPGDEDEVARFAEAFDDPVVADSTRRFLADERHLLLLAYLDDRPAGFVSAVQIGHPDKARDEIFLNEIGVVESAQRRGVARALVEELKRVGRERGCTSMWVLTDDTNDAAKGLYGSTGGHQVSGAHLMFEYDLRNE
jgi:ribosomal protein S18 acetylase RimI-like enzyme